MIPLSRPDEIRLQIQKLVELPTFSVVAQRVLAVIGNDELTVAQVAAIIEQDPALMARIIGVANSAYFNCHSPVTSVEKAIFNVLGLKLTKNLALSIALIGPFNTTQCAGFNAAEYWFGAVMCAALVQRICRKASGAGAPPEDEAYLAGMLHNFGLLPLVYLYPGEMALAFAERKQHGSLVRAERHLLGTDHHEAGGWLARRWHMPDSIIAAIEHHGEPDYREEGWHLVHVVRYGAIWAGRHYAYSEQTQAGQNTEQAEHWLMQLGLGPRDLLSIQNELLAERDDVMALAKILALG